jgi:flagellar assembly protein FliH
MQLSYKVIKSPNVGATDEQVVIPVEKDFLHEKEESILAEDMIQTPVAIVESGRLDPREKEAIIDSIRQEIYDEMNAEREEIIENAHREAIRIKDEVYNTTYAESKEAGYSEGRAEAEAEIAAAREEMYACVEKAKTQNETYMDEYRDDIIELSINIAENIINHKIYDNKEELLYIIEPVLKDFHENMQVTLAFSPSNINFINQHKKSIEDMAPQARFYYLEDSNLEAGDFLVSSKSYDVDLKVKTQLDNIRKELINMRGQMK